MAVTAKNLEKYASFLLALTDTSRELSSLCELQPFECIFDFFIFIFLILSGQHAYSPESDSESRHRRHKRDRDGSRRNGGYEELEDGELGEDGEIQ